MVARCTLLLSVLISTGACSPVGESIDESTQAADQSTAALSLPQLTLLDADTGKALTSLNTSGDTFTLAALGATKFTVIAPAQSPALSVRFDFGDQVNYRIENGSPFSLFGDKNGTYGGMPLVKGTYRVTATYFSKTKAAGTSLGSASSTFSIVDGSTAPGPAPTPALPPLPKKEDPTWYILDKVNGGINYDLLDRPRVDGLSIRIRWSSIHTGAGQFDFRPIDELAGHAKRRGKPWTMRVMAGTSAPAWIDCPRYTYSDGVSANSIPYPWDPNHRQAYVELVQALGQKYNGDPLLTIVHIPGYAESAEMHYPNGLEGVTGYSHDKMAQAWNDRFDAMAKAFPNKLIDLNHSPEPFSPAVVVHARTYGRDTVLFQMNALKASTSTTWDGYTRLVDLDREGFAVGFQFVGPSDNVTRFGGSFEESVVKGANAGSRFYEVYQSDVDSIPN